MLNGLRAIVTNEALPDPQIELKQLVHIQSQVGRYGQLSLVFHLVHDLDDSQLAMSIRPCTRELLPRHTLTFLITTHSESALVHLQHSGRDLEIAATS